jgi:hypothetical protein
MGFSETTSARLLYPPIPLARESIEYQLNQTGNDNECQNSSEVLPVINNLGNATSDNGTVVLGAAGMQDKRVSNLVFTAFNNRF